MAVIGVESVVKALLDIPKDLRRGALRNALAAGGRVVRDDAKRAAPVLANVVIRKSTGQVVRKPGTLRDAIKVRTSKRARSMGDVGVFVNVVPAKGAKFKTTRGQVLGRTIKKRVVVRKSLRGAESPNDPYYWRFVEFGTAKGAAAKFLQGAAQRLPDALKAAEAALVRYFKRLQKKGRL